MPDETPLTAKILVVDDEETNVRLLEGHPIPLDLVAHTRHVRGRCNAGSGRYVEREHRCCKCGNHNAGVCVHKRANANFNFEIVWSSSPTFSTLADQFQHKIANPAVANNCCAPLAGPEGYFSVSTPAT